ncbi:MAG: hypothetical protein K2H89_11485 [Oscillospiraceae bacterium]|nr:hypothetical protein [Oscillospiraceae bacterium]
MATSSITENIRINNPKAIEVFLQAMEASEKVYPTETEIPESNVVTDPEIMKDFMEKALKRRKSNHG